jgi:hypothetical protein
MAAQRQNRPMPDEYRPTSRRQHLVIVAVTVATVVGLWLLLLYRPGGHPRTYAPTACAAGQSRGCIGGQADVVLLSASAAAPATSATTGSLSR